MCLEAGSWQLQAEAVDGIPGAASRLRETSFVVAPLLRLRRSLRQADA
jgi:hypothetical protein